MSTGTEIRATCGGCDSRNLGWHEATCRYLASNFRHKPYTPDEAAGLVAHPSDSPYSRADPNRVLNTAVQLRSAHRELERADEWRQALEVIGEYPCSHGDECQGRETKCPSCLAHAVLAEPAREEE